MQQETVAAPPLKFRREIGGKEQQLEPFQIYSVFPGLHTRSMSFIASAILQVKAHQVNFFFKLNIKAFLEKNS